MFANTYQSGYTLEVWDSRVNSEKNPLYKQLFKKIPSSIKNFYDKQVKSFIYELEGNQKLNFPYDDRQQLSLHQRYIVFQIYIPIGSNWSLQLGINDLNSNKKRINITTHSGKQQLKYFSFRYPLQNGLIQKGVWSFLAIDIYSFCNAFKNTVFRSLDTILLCSSCKIRRIFTMKQWVQFQIPKGYWLAANIPQTMQLIQFKQSKQFKQQFNNNSMSISMSPPSIHHSKMVQSKIGMENQNYSLRNSQKISPFQQQKSSNASKVAVKLPGVNNNRMMNRQKQFTPLKSSKISQKQQISRSELARDVLIGKSNRSLTKADIIIQKSKIRLNSLQQKQDEILNRLKSQQNRFTQKQPSIKQKAKFSKNQNIFKSDLFKSQLSQSQQSKGKLIMSPKQLKVKKKFEQDNIFREQSYSSSLSRNTYKDTFYARNSNIKLNSIDQQVLIPAVHKSPNNIQRINISKQLLVNSQSQQDSPKKFIDNNSFLKNKIKQKISNIKQKQQIIEQDVWTDDQNNQEKIQQSIPIQEMILSQEVIVNKNQKLNQGKVKNQNLTTNRNKNSIKQDKKQNHVNKQQKGIHQENGQNLKNKQVQKPYPEKNSSHLKGQTIITRQNNKEVVIKQNLNSLKNANELQLIYDEMIGCYYHPETNTYYQIKN